jgi:hypothetical protein
MRSCQLASRVKQNAANRFRAGIRLFIRTNGTAVEQRVNQKRASFRAESLGRKKLAKYLHYRKVGRRARETMTWSNALFPGRVWFPKPYPGPVSRPCIGMAGQSLSCRNDEGYCDDLVAAASRRARLRLGCTSQATAMLTMYSATMGAAKMHMFRMSVVGVTMAAMMKMTRIE